MKAGDLRRRVEIGRLVTQDDGYGGTMTVWQTFATVWAEIQDLTGREYWAAQQVQSLVTTRVRIRYLAGLTPAMQIKADGKTYAITSIQDPDGKHRELILMAKPA